MNDLTDKEQRAVRTALRFLRLRVGAWGPLAKALRYEWDSIQRVATGKQAVTQVLAKCVAHNLCCVVKTIFTAGLAPRFWSDAPLALVQP